MRYLLSLLCVCVLALKAAGGEPVYDVVVYGDSSGAVTAAIAAGQAIDLQSSVQDVPYPALRDRLEAAKQIVRPELWKRPPAAETKTVAKP